MTEPAYLYRPTGETCRAWRVPPGPAELPDWLDGRVAWIEGGVRVARRHVAPGDWVVEDGILTLNVVTAADFHRNFTLIEGEL